MLGAQGLQQHAQECWLKLMQDWVRMHLSVFSTVFAVVLMRSVCYGGGPYPCITYAMATVADQHGASTSAAST